MALESVTITVKKLHKKNYQRLSYESKVTRWTHKQKVQKAEGYYYMCILITVLNRVIMNIVTHLLRCVNTEHWRNLVTLKPVPVNPSYAHGCDRKTTYTPYRTLNLLNIQSLSYKSFICHEIISSNYIDSCVYLKPGSEWRWLNPLIESTHPDFIF